MFTTVAEVPKAIFAIDVHEWTGLKTDELIHLFDGASPVSVGATPEFLAVVDAIQKDDSALRILESGQTNPGDVLVTSTHSEAFNAVAARVVAIITDTGGILSHLSIVSRELGIPCVVACKNATTAIQEGALVRVDGETGKISVLS